MLPKRIWLCSFHSKHSLVIDFSSIIIILCSIFLQHIEILCHQIKSFFSIFTCYAFDHLTAIYTRYIHQPKENQYRLCIQLLIFSFFLQKVNIYIYIYQTPNGEKFLCSMLPNFMAFLVSLSWMALTYSCYLLE